MGSISNAYKYHQLIGYVTEKELCITCVTKYISTSLTRVKNVSVVPSIGIILCSFVEKIDIERDIKNKLPICTLSQKTGQVRKECRISYDRVHKRSTKEERL